MNDFGLKKELNSSNVKQVAVATHDEIGETVKVAKY